MRSLTELLTSALITVALLPLFAMTARADLWNNGGPINDNTGYCDTQNPCGGSVNGFWVADDFSIAARSVISSFSYYDFFSPFFFNSSINHYLGTDWVITSGDPFTTPPIASGSSSGNSQLSLLTIFSIAIALVTVTGLERFPGARNLLAWNTDSAGGRRCLDSRGCKRQWSARLGSIRSGVDRNTSGVTATSAFTATQPQAVNPSPTPEPALYGLLGFGLAALFLIQSERQVPSQVGIKTARGGIATR